MDRFFDELTDLLPPAWHWLARRRIWLTLIWFVAIFGVGQRFVHSRAEFRNQRNYTADQLRPTGGRGHLQIDFAGQWLMGRMVATGNGQRLYDRNVQWGLVRQGFPRAAEPPYLRDGVFPAERFPGKGPDDQTDHDAESLMSWLMGQKNEPAAWQKVGAAVGTALATENPWSVLASLQIAQGAITQNDVAEINRPVVGGPLYPPILGVLYAPLGMIESPQFAYELLQALLLVATVIAGKGISYLSNGRIWWPIAIVALLLAPGCRSGTDLAQNAAFSTCVLVWGWALIARSRDLSGGAVLGLLAFKPVWALAFFFAPVLMRKWRCAGVMGAVGLLQIALTLPVVGVHTWKDWLAVGQEASETYCVNQSWIQLSRDVGGAVRRPLLDFTKPEAERRNPVADRLANGALASILAVTALIALTCGNRREVGLSAGFLLLGCYLGCYRFMYYDAMLLSVAFAALLAETSWADRPGQCDDGPARHALRLFRSVPFLTLLVLLFIENVVTTWGLKGRLTWEIFGDPKAPHGLDWEIGFRWPWDTLLILGLWAWLGARLVFSKTIGRLLAPQQT